MALRWVANDIQDSGNIGNSTSLVTEVNAIPSDGSQVYIRLWYRAAGSAWAFVDVQFQAPSSTAPEVLSLDLTGDLLTVTFNKNMTTQYFTTGSYIPRDTYWLIAQTFVVDYEFYQTGGSITLVSHGFLSKDGGSLSEDVVFVFP